jgi:hypothetical protein
MIAFITFTDHVGTIGAEYAKEMDSHVAIVLSLMLAIHPVATFLMELVSILLSLVLNQKTNVNTASAYQLVTWLELAQDHLQQIVMEQIYALSMGVTHSLDGKIVYV